MRFLSPLIVSFALTASAALPLPQVPDSLRTVASRADFVALNFWNAMQWNDTIATSSSVMTQSVADFVSVFPHMSGDTARIAAINNLTRHAVAAGETTAITLSEAIETILFDAHSPQRDETLYTLFAQSLLSSGAPDSVRLEYMLEMTRKNMAGTYAADFEFTARTTTTAHRLSDLRGKKVLLLFYDPSCDDCHRLANALALDTIIKRAVTAEQLVVLAVSPEDADEWRNAGEWLPLQWIDATDNGAIYTNELYDIGSFPSLYLIDTDGRVLIKDGLPEQIIPRI